MTAGVILADRPPRFLADTSADVAALWVSLPYPAGEQFRVSTGEVAADLSWNRERVAAALDAAIARGVLDVVTRRRPGVAGVYAWTADHRATLTTSRHELRSILDRFGTSAAWITVAVSARCVRGPWCDTTVRQIARATRLAVSTVQAWITKLTEPGGPLERLRFGRWARNPADRTPSRFRLTSFGRRSVEKPRNVRRYTRTDSRTKSARRPWSRDRLCPEIGTRSPLTKGTGPAGHSGAGGGTPDRVPDLTERDRIAAAAFFASYRSRRFA